MLRYSAKEMRDIMDGSVPCPVEFLLSNRR
jgi:hypothetical protein